MHCNITEKKSVCSSCSDFEKSKWTTWLYLHKISRHDQGPRQEFLFHFYFISVQASCISVKNCGFIWEEIEVKEDLLSATSHDKNSGRSTFLKQLFKYGKFLRYTSALSIPNVSVLL